MAADSITAGISAASGLLGVVIGGWITLRNQRLERSQRFIRDQLTDFYAPMLGIRERLHARNDIRQKVRDTARGVLQPLRAEACGAFEKVIEDDNRQLEDIELPLYRQMVKLFTDKMHLTEPSTRQHFRAVIEFAELWDRWLRGALPAEVVERIGRNENNLSGFYSDLETHFERLQAALKEQS